jgi:hypothetical protein
MDVPNYHNEMNYTKDNISLSAFTTNHTASTNNATLNNRIMHLVITAIMIALFSLIVVYCLYVQNWWLLGILAIPLIRKAMLKILERHL